MRLKSNTLPGRFQTLLFSCFVVAGLLWQPTSCQAADAPKVIPVAEWTWRAKWSPDGRFVAVNWPAPALVGADGKLSRVIGKPNKQSRGIWVPNPVVLSDFGKGRVAVMDNSEKKRTLVLKADSYERLPIEFPDLSTLSWSPDGKMIAGKELMGEGSVFCLPSGKVCMTFASEGEFAWSPDSKLIAASHRTGIDVWDVAKKKKVFAFPELRAGMHSSLAWSPDGSKLAASVARSNSSMVQSLLRIYSADGKELLAVKSKSGIWGIGWSKDRNLFAYSDTALHILDGSTLKPVKVLAPSNAECVSFAWSPDGKLLAYNGDGSDLSLHVFDMSKMQELSVIPAEKTGRYSFRWSPDSTCLLIKADNQLAVCRASDGKYLGAKLVSDASLVDWTPNGNLTVSGFLTHSISIEPVNLRSRTGVFEKGTIGNPWLNQKVLCSLADCFEDMNRFLSKDYIEKLKNTKKEDLCIYQGGPGLGMTLRNTWGLRGKNPLTAYFGRFGVTDGADMSSCIIEAYWLHLNGMPFDEKKLIAAYGGRRKEPEYIISEGKPLPNELLQFKRLSTGSEFLPVNQLPGGVKVISFISEKGYFSLSQLKALDFVRTRYLEKQVSIAVVKFPAGALPENALGWKGGDECIAEISKLEAKNKSAIYFGQGTTAIFNSLKEFAGEDFGGRSGALPQTLIISAKNIVTTRINGPVSEEDTYPIEDAVDELIKNNGN